jgi:hypothetical protein
MKHFSRNLLLSSTNSSIQLVQIVHKHSTESEVEVLSVSEDQLIFSNVRDYDIKSIFFQINIPTGPYQPSAMAIMSAQRDTIITIHQHTLKLEPVGELSALSLELSRYHLQMLGPSTNCYLSAKEEMCAQCNLVRQPGGAADIIQNGRPARLHFKNISSMLA